MKKIILLIFLLTLSMSFAGNQTGKVEYIKIRSDGLLKIGLDSDWTDKAACANKSWWVIKDENSQAGKAQLSLFMTAHASGKAVKIGGHPNGGTCTRISGGEDIRNVNMLNY